MDDPRTAKDQHQELQAGMTADPRTSQHAFAELQRLRHDQPELIPQAGHFLLMMLDAIDDGVWDWNVKTGEVYFSQQWMATLGYHPDDVPPHINFRHQIVHPDDRARMEQALRSHFSGHTPLYECESRLRMKSGDWRWSLHRGKVVEWDEKGQPIRMVGLDTDISQRKRMEQALRESEERFHTTFDQAAVGIAHVDRNGRWLRVNQRLCEILGYEREELLQKTFRDISHPEDLPTDWDHLRRLESGEIDTYTLERRCIRKAGSIIWVTLTVSLARERSGRAKYFVGVLRDISERKRAEAERDRLLQQLEIEQERLRAIMQQLPSGLMIAEAPSGKIVQYNDEAVRLMGHPVLGGDDYTGCRQYGALHPDGRPYQAEEYPIVRAAVFGETVNQEDIVYRRGDGTITEFSVSAAPIRDFEGKIVAAVSTFHDVADRRRAEQQLKTLAETLEQRVAERTAEAEQRAAQLRAMALQLAQAEQHERRRLAQVLHDHLQQLLVVARMTLGSLKRQADGSNLMETIQQVDDLLGESIEASRSLTMELSPPVLYDAGLIAGLQWLARQKEEKHGLSVDVVADSRAEPSSEAVCIFLFQAVRELLFNIIKHADTHQARVEMTAPEENRIQIVVSDAGSGFDPVQMEQDPKSKTGFGLFSIRERLRLMGGHLQVDSSVGQGTRITISLSRAQPAKRTSKKSRGKQTGGAASGRSAAAVSHLSAITEDRGRIRVLLVDDHDILRQGLVSLLHAEPDIEVVAEASDGEMAVDLAFQHQPDVVVMDVSMPKMDGIEATRRITSELPDVRVIGLSMHERADMAAKMKEAGAIAYLPKADTSEDLVSIILDEPTCEGGSRGH